MITGEMNGSTSLIRPLRRDNGKVRPETERMVGNGAGLALSASNEPPDGTGD